MSNIIQAIENEQLKKDIPDFRPGDTVVVQVKVKEGTRERLQAFEGVVIAKRNRGINSAFIVRKISHGEGVERTFQTHSNAIAEIIIKRRGDVRRAKLYYLRERSGRSARIKEKIMTRAQLDKIKAAKAEEQAKLKVEADAAAKAVEAKKSAEAVKETAPVVEKTEQEVSEKKKEEASKTEEK